MRISWFQGRIPFAFDLPELKNSEFVLLGGRMTYLDQAPGAHLIYDVRKHHISVFVFQERSVPARREEDSVALKPRHDLASGGDLLFDRKFPSPAQGDFRSG